jgi:N utilization substance protein A
LAREETIHKEILRPKQRINAILYSVNREGRGAQLLLSRARPEMLIALMKKKFQKFLKKSSKLKQLLVNQVFVLKLQ